MKTEKYDDKWSIATNDKGEKFWIDKENNKAYESNTGPSSVFGGTVGKERRDIVVVDKD
jgi:hypothetical protein